MKQTSLNPTLLLTNLLGLTGLAGTVSAQIFFSAGSPYTQNFDSLASGGTNDWTENVTIPGWYASKSGGDPTITNYVANHGNSTSGWLYSFGADGSSERALGALPTSALGNFAFGVRFKNDTDRVITNLVISYTGEQWRQAGNANVQTLRFGYRISANPITSADAASVGSWTTFSALDFSSPMVGSSGGALDGEADANRQSFADVLLPDVVVFPGQEIFFRWYDARISSYNHALAIDDFAIAFSTCVPFTNAPAITRQPGSVTNNAGTTAVFTAAASGSSLSYQWRKNGYGLYDSSKYAGCLTPSLMVSNVLAQDKGEYALFVVNGAGSVTSTVALLTVMDPTIHNQPQDRTAAMGDSIEFAVGATGTVPLSYQWRFNGQNMAQATGSRLSWTNVQPTNAGPYSVVVGNYLGTYATSAVATLTVLTPPANLLAEWDFNATNTMTADAPSPSIGSGTAALVATKGSFSVGSPTDPADAAGGTNAGWNTSGYAAQGTSNKLTGVQFNVSTLGYQDLLIAWQERHSNTASKYMRLQYSADGVNFNDGQLLTMTATDNSFVFYSVNLAGIPVLNDNANFAFRVVSEFESTAIGTANDNYVATATSYGTAGTIRFDLVRVFANPVGTVSPIPLQIQQWGDALVLTWANPAFSLASAEDPAGPYIKIADAVSPYTNMPSASARFFKLVYP